MMKKGLVLEGGAMRGMYTAGVLDVFLENNIEFDGAVGVSAGACFGCNYKSKQIGRTIRYNKKYSRDKRYVSFSNFIKTGDVYGIDFCYDKLPNEYDVFDVETFRKSPMEFWVVATDANTGKAVYHKCELGNGEDLQWFRASAAMPMLSKVVKIDDMELSDGGTADSIPIKFFEDNGYEKNVVILTQHEGFVKKKNKFLPLLRYTLKKYPELINALSIRHTMYNETLEYLKEQELLKKVFVIKPSVPLEVGAVEHNPDELERVYQIGRKDALKKLNDVIEFLKG